MGAVELAVWLVQEEAALPFRDLLDDMLRLLPGGHEFHEDNWNVISWITKVGNAKEKNARFGRIKHEELKCLCKLWVLNDRLTGSINSLAGADQRIRAFAALSETLGARSFKTLKTDDFRAAEDWLAKSFESAHRVASYLHQASAWLSLNFDLRLDYRNRLTNPAVHGRYGTDEGRESKLLPSEIIRDLFLALHRHDLIARDRFFLPVLVVSVGGGFRVGELATLPANCLLKIDGKLHLLHHPEKGGVPIPRPIHPLLADAVEDAVGRLIEQTKDARELAKQLRASPRLDWSGIILDRKTFRYFTAKWAHEWTANPNHLMINPAGAWYNKGNCFIDAVALYEAAGRNKVQAARSLGVCRLTFSDLLEAQEAARLGMLPQARNRKWRGKARRSWDTDLRVISVAKLMAHCGTQLKPEKLELVRDIVDEAQGLQLQGKIYPAPLVDTELEARFQRKIQPILKDKKGNGVLYQDEALLVVQKYALSEHRGTKEADFTSLTDSHISRWLAGEARSAGTGNTEDSVFSRLGIMDPRTGEIAKFTNHDLRHWLNTLYQNGGLTEDQIALIFNRRYQKQNATYDQTSSKVRTGRLKQAVRDQLVVGQVSESYGRIAEYSREDAEDYLRAVLRMVNPMPHGVCTLDWATTPCPHHLSCFSSSEERPCEHLVVEPLHEQTVQELERIQREAELTISAIASQGVRHSPTTEHFERIGRNIAITLEDVRAVRAKEKAGG
ncbi:MAG: hypothetical protein O9303_08310 [Silanimonas sp.]|nr:hypothetical protein [Silanimonas sp.]